MAVYTPYTAGHRPEIKPGDRLARAPLSPEGEGDLLGQGLAELLQRASHLRLDRAHGAVADLGDLLVSQVAVLPEQKDLLFVRPQGQDGPAELLQRFLAFQRLAGCRFVACEHRFFPTEELGPAVPGAALQVLSSVEAHPENPGAHV